MLQKVTIEQVLAIAKAFPPFQNQAKEVYFL